MRVYYVVMRQDKKGKRHREQTYPYTEDGYESVRGDMQSFVEGDSDSSFELKVLIVNCKCDITTRSHAHILTDVKFDEQFEFDLVWVDYDTTDTPDEDVELIEIPDDHVRTPDGNIIHVDEVQPSEPTVGTQQMIREMLSIDF